MKKAGFKLDGSWRLFRHDFAGKGKWFRSQTFLVPRFPPHANIARKRRDTQRRSI
jgi:hypothetical protein